MLYRKYVWSNTFKTKCEKYSLTILFISKFSILAVTINKLFLSNDYFYQIEKYYIASECVFFSLWISFLYILKFVYIYMCVCLVWCVYTYLLRAYFMFSIILTTTKLASRLFLLSVIYFILNNISYADIISFSVFEYLFSINM